MMSVSDFTFSVLTTEIRRHFEKAIAENKFSVLDPVLQSDQGHQFYDVLIICVLFIVYVCFFRYQVNGPGV